MKLTKTVKISFALFSFLFLSVSSLLALDFPRPIGYVNDFAGIFSSYYSTSLEQDLSSFEKETTIELVVVTIESLQETTIEEYAVRLFEDWRIGKKGEDNGLLLLVAPNERKLKIEVGYGLEPIITDGRAGRIIREEITPEFKKSNYEQGVQKGIARLEDYLLADEPPKEIEKVVEKAEGNFPMVVIAFIILVYLSSFWGRTKRVWPGGVVGIILGFITGLIIGAFTWRIFLALILGLFGFILDLFLSRNYKSLKKAGKPTSFWRSGGGFFSGGSSSSGGGSFGGFGGGSSGGGGASGSW